MRRRRQERWKTTVTVGLISKQLCTCSTLFRTFLCRCFARLQRETFRNFLVTRYDLQRRFLLQYSVQHCRDIVSSSYNIDSTLCCAKNRRCVSSCVTSPLWKKYRAFSFSLFFHCRSFSPWWLLAFLIFSPRPQNFILFLQQRISPLFFVSSSFSRWASLACRLLS